MFDDPPHSCQQGVCTTCAGLIRSGELGVNFKVAVDALDSNQKEQVHTSNAETIVTASQPMFFLGGEGCGVK